MVIGWVFGVGGFCIAIGIGWATVNNLSMRIDNLESGRTTPMSTETRYRVQRIDVDLDALEQRVDKLEQRVYQLERGNAHDR
jgi:HD superfamily phosphodiesterase